MCDEPHDHRTIKIVLETSKNFEICQKLDQEARELFSQILLKEEAFKEFLAVAKELCRKYERDEPNDKNFIDEDFANFHKVKSQWEATFSQAKE